MKKLTLHELEKLQLNENGMRDTKGGIRLDNINEINECFGYGSSGNAKITAGVLVPYPPEPIGPIKPGDPIRLIDLDPIDISVPIIL